jgi:hypothetical protein
VGITCGQGRFGAGHSGPPGTTRLRKTGLCNKGPHGLTHRDRAFPLPGNNQVNHSDAESTWHASARLLPPIGGDRSHNVTAAAADLVVTKRDRLDHRSSLHLVEIARAAAGLAGEEKRAGGSPTPDSACRHDPPSPAGDPDGRTYSATAPKRPTPHPIPWPGWTNVTPPAPRTTLHQAKPRRAGLLRRNPART